MGVFNWLQVWFKREIVLYSTCGGHLKKLKDELP